MTINKMVRLATAGQLSEIITEMQQAADLFLEIGYGVSVFGSARIQPDSPYYAMALELGRRLAKAGITVIAGGGPGIMEAVNHGAFEAGGTSVGLNIRLPRETDNNPYQTHSLHFKHFASRKTTFFAHSVGYIILPGGFGTLDEFFEVLTLVQTRKAPPAPIILVGSAYWSGLLDWIKAQTLALGLISPQDLNLFKVCDDADAVMREIEASCGDYVEGADCAAQPGQPPIPA